MQRGCAPQRAAHPRGPTFLAVGSAAPLGVVLDLYLLAPYVLLNYLPLFHNFLADAHLFLEDRALVHNDLFLGYRYHDLVVSDLGLRGLALYGHPFDVYLFVPCGDLYALAVGSHALSDPYCASLAFAGSDPKLLLGSLHPHLVLIAHVGGTSHTRRLGALLGIVGSVGAALLDGGSTLEAVVGVDLILELGGDLTVVVVGGAVLDCLLVCCDLDDLPRVVDPRHLERDQGSTGSQEAHLHAYVFGAIVLVYEQVVYVADFLVALVVDRVACVAVLYFLRELVSARFAFQGKYLHLGCFVRTYIANSTHSPGKAKR